MLVRRLGKDTSTQQILVLFLAASLHRQIACFLCVPVFLFLNWAIYKNLEESVHCVKFSLKRLRRGLQDANAFLVYVVPLPDREFLLRVSQFEIFASDALKIVK